jgi:hypothetical protein
MPSGFSKLASRLRNLARHVRRNIRRRRFRRRCTSLVSGLAEMFGGTPGRFRGLTGIALTERASGLLHRFAGRLRRVLTGSGLLRRLREIERLRSEILRDLGELLAEFVRRRGKLLLAGLLRRAPRLSGLRGPLERFGLRGLTLGQFGGPLLELLPSCSAACPADWAAARALRAASPSRP